jgi:hypothetical protein
MLVSFSAMEPVVVSHDCIELCAPHLLQTPNQLNQCTHDYDWLLNLIYPPHCCVRGDERLITEQCQNSNSCDSRGERWRLDWHWEQWEQCVDEVEQCHPFIQ